MNRVGLLKGTGLLVGSMVLMMVGVYFLYPHLNEEGYREAISESPEAEPAPEGGDRDYIGMEFEDLTVQIEELRNEERRLLDMVDSLTDLNSELTAGLDEAQTEVDAQSEAAAGADPGGEPGEAGLFADSGGGDEDISDSGLSERVKSLLNLDEGELAPIINQMTNDQLILLYRSGGTIQREKLLRSLNPERAAELISEVML